MVLHEKTIGVNLEDDDSTFDTCQTLFSTYMHTDYGEEKVDDVQENHNDPDEGELINIV